MAHLEGTLVRLRAPEPEDADLLNPAFSDPDVLATLASVRFPQPVENFREFLASTRGSSTVNFTILRQDTGAPIGVMGLMEVTSLFTAPELGVWIGRDSWDQGFGTDAVRTLCRHAFQDMGIHRVALTVLATNERAQRAYAKVGFRLEGTLRQQIYTGGAWVDVHQMGLLASELSG